MHRTILFATAALAAYAAAVVVSPGDRLPFSAPGDELLGYLDGTTGEGTYRKPLPAGDVSLVARVLCGEVAGQGDTEVRAVAGVILNRAVRASNRTLADVLFHNNGRGTWAFTALDPVRANPENVWGKASSPGSRCHRRMTRLVEEEHQRGVKHSWDSYWHPHAMKPAGATPRWARGRKATRVGDAMFVTVNKGG